MRLQWLAASAGAAFGAALVPAHAATETVLYSFTGGADSSGPVAPILIGANGTLYGTTSGQGGNPSSGAVFSLKPPMAGQTTWTPSVLHTFGAGGDGANPSGGLIAGAGGALYGTTAGGSGLGGTVFELIPPAAGQTQWTETILHGLTGPGEGNGIYGGLVADGAGALYGTAFSGGTHNFGTAFKVAPPAAAQTSWSFSVVHAFAGGKDGYGPQCTLAIDGAGALYGTSFYGGTSNLGTAYRLTPPTAGQTKWTELTLHSFKGGLDGEYLVSGLTGDGTGAFYGTTQNGGRVGYPGTVFKLTPPPAGQTKWVETVLHSFTGGLDGSIPQAEVVLGPAGSLYGTTQGGGRYNDGTVFRLDPPAAGAKVWKETVLHSFKGGPSDGRYPSAKLAIDASGALYGTTLQGGKTDAGTVFKIVP